MEAEDRERLRRNYRLLVTLNLVDVQDTLVQEGVLDEQVLERIENQATDQDKMRRLLRELICRGGPHAYSVFCQALEEQDTYQHVLNALSATDVSSASRKVMDSAEMVKSEKSTLEDWLRLKSNYKLLIESVSYSDVRDHLYQEGVLDDDTTETLDLMVGKTEKDRMRTLHKTLLEKRCYSSFCDALKPYPRYRHLLEKMEKTDVEAARQKFGSLISSMEYCDHNGNPRSPGSSHSTSLSTPGSSQHGNGQQQQQQQQQPRLDPNERASLQKAVSVVSRDSMCVQKWKELRILPGLDESDICHVKHMYKSDGPRECLYQLLMCWQQKRGSRATVQELTETLDEAGMRAAIVAIRKQCSPT